MQELSYQYQLLIEKFKEYLDLRGFTGRTLISYPLDVKRFLKYVDHSLKIDHIENVEVQHLRQYNKFLLLDINKHTGKPLHQNTRLRAMVVVRTFYKYLVSSGTVYVNPSLYVELPKTTDSLPANILTPYEMSKLLKMPDLNTPLGIRDKAVMELLYSSGIRNRELRTLKIQDVDLKGQSLFVLGKGNKQAIVPFGKEAKRSLEHYLYFARNKLKPRLDTPLFFISNRGNAFDHWSITLMIRKYTGLAKIDKNISPHSFRHSCGSHLIKNGANIRHVQELLRHKSLETTKVYTRLNVNDVRKAQRLYHPREKYYGK